MTASDTSKERRSLQSSIVTSTADFATLEEEWNELYENSSRATPFQSFGWLFSWWSHYAGSPDTSNYSPYSLKLIIIRDFQSSKRGLLVGVLPFTLVRRFASLKILNVLGSGVTDYLDIIVRDDYETEICEVGADAMMHIEGWSLGDFRQLRPESLCFSLLKYVQLSQSKLLEESYPRIVASDWDEAVTLSSSRNLRSMARRSVKRLRTDNLMRNNVTKGATSERIELAVRNLVNLHREYWRDRNIAPEHLTDRFELLLINSAEKMVKNGDMEIREFVVGNEILASQIVLLRDDYVGHLISGAKPSATMRYQLSSLFIYDGFEVVERLHSGYLDLLRGDEPYKLRWNPEIVPGTRVIFGKSVATRLVYATLVGCYSSIRRLSNSNDSPAPIRVLLSAMKSLHSFLVRVRTRD